MCGTLHLLGYCTVELRQLGICNHELVIGYSERVSRTQSCTEIALNFLASLNSLQSLNRFGGLEHKVLQSKEGRTGIMDFGELLCHGTSEWES